MPTKWKITSEELTEKIREGCQLIDIRDTSTIAYGMIPQALAGRQ